MVTAPIRKSPESIDRRSRLDRKELMEQYINPAIPVIITDAVDHWPALGKFTPEFFQKNYGHITKEVKGVEYNMADFVDRMLISCKENPAPYPFSFDMEDTFPELMKDIRPDVVFGKVDRINHPLVPRFMIYGTIIYEIFLGGKGSSFPFLHVDALYMNTQITQLYGSKEFILYGPDQNKFLYPKPDNEKVSQVDVLNPDYDKFPLFREAKPMHFILGRGETLFFPSGWWHTTKIHEPSITFGRAQLNSNNWNRYIDDEYKVWKNHKPVVAPFIKLYGKLLNPVLHLQEMLS